jgi:hypothetical protein
MSKLVQTETATQVHLFAHRGWQRFDFYQIKAETGDAAQIRESLL